VEMQKYIKKVRDEANEDMERYLGVLNEATTEHMKAIRESFIDTNRKLDSHSEMIAEMKEDITVIKEDISVLKDDVSELKKDMVTVKKDIVEMKGDISEFKKDMKEVKGDLKKKVDYTEFVTLRQKVSETK